MNFGDFIQGVKRATGSLDPEERNLILEVQGHPTMVLKDWLDAEARTRSWYKADRVRFSELEPSKFQVNIYYSDPLKEGLSLPNFLDMLAYPHTWESIPLAIDENGEAKVLNWVNSPHGLFGGATGSGKSVGVNALIGGFLTSRECANMVFLDPKMVEFTDWASIAAAHETETEDIVSTLDSLCELMDARYSWMKDRGVKSLWDDPATMAEVGGPVLVVVDEVADLLNVSGKEAGTPIGRLAQKGRAAAVHLLLATQNPRADMFAAKSGTGSLKANLTRRIAFRTKTGAESNIILADGTSAPASGADASLISEEMPGVAVDDRNIQFRVPKVDEPFIEMLIRSVQARADWTIHSLDELHGLVEEAGPAELLEASAGPEGEALFEAEEEAE